MLLGWWYARDKRYFFAEHLRTEQVLENKGTVAKYATVIASPVHVLCPSVSI